MPAIAALIILAAWVAAANAQNQPMEVGDTLEPTLGAYWPYAQGDQKGFVNLRIVDNQFRLYFLEEDRDTIAEPALPHAVIHYSNTQRRSLNNQTLTLSRSGGPFLGNPRFIQAPHRYQVRIFLTPQLGQGADDSDGIILGQQILNQLSAADPQADETGPGGN